MRKEDFPTMSVGDVLRVHGVKVEEYNEHLTGRVFDPRSVTVFPGVSGSMIHPVSTKPNATFTEYDKARVEELREWWAEIELFQGPIFSEHELSVKDIKCPMTFDLVCKINEIFDSINDSTISDNTYPESGKVLRVSDGTKSQLAFLSLSDDPGGSNTSNVVLESHASQLSVDIFIRTSSDSFLKDVKTGSIVLLSGIRCVKEVFSLGNVALTAFRLIVPKDTKAECKVLSSKHSCYKRINKKILEADTSQNTTALSDSLALIVGEKSNNNHQQMAADETLFPNSESFNRMVIGATNISGSPQLQPQTVLPCDVDTSTGKDQRSSHQNGQIQKEKQQNSEEEHQQDSNHFRLSQDRQREQSQTGLTKEQQSQRELQQQSQVSEQGLTKQHSQNGVIRKQQRCHEPSQSEGQQYSGEGIQRQGNQLQSHCGQNQQTGRKDASKLVSSEESDSMPMVQYYSANIEELDIIMSQSSEQDSDLNLGQAGQGPGKIPTSDANQSLSFTSVVSSSKSTEYLSCNEDDLSRSRCSPSPERSVLSITTQTNYPWTTVSDILNPQFALGQYRIEGYVVEVDADPSKMVAALCPNEECNAVSTVELKLLRKQERFEPSPRCISCYRKSKTIFCITAKVRETASSNFAMPGPAIQVFCSGPHAEKLFACTAEQFCSKKSVRDNIVAKWANVVTKPVKVSILVSRVDYTVTEFHIIDSEICK